MGLAPSLNWSCNDRKERAETLVIRKRLHRMARTMRSTFPIRRVPTRTALVLCVMAAAIPALIFFSREVDAAGTHADAQMAVVTTAVSRTPAWGSDAVHSISMLAVGSLLIGAGSAIRRAA